MMMSEFTERTGYEPSYDEYKMIEASYYEFDGDKNAFCKQWKKDQKNGQWAKELKLRQTIEEQKNEYEAKIEEIETYKNFYRTYYYQIQGMKALLEKTQAENDALKAEIASLNEKAYDLINDLIA